VTSGDNEWLMHQTEDVGKKRLSDGLEIDIGEVKEKVRQ
jgi:hypothetical protein